MGLFEHIETNKKIVLCTLHFKAKPLYEHVREKEVVQYLEHIKDFIKEIKSNEKATEEEIEKIPLIISGDFNDVPKSATLKHMYNSVDVLGTKLKSAYEVDGKYPEYSTYKYRNDIVTKHVIDYVWYNKYLSLKSIREFPEESEIPEDMGNPCHRYPSDHFSTATTFEY